MNHPDLYRSFLAIVETASFTEAAEQLGLKQSTISQQIKRLEASLKRQLFIRDTHSVTLTGDGDALVDLARRIVDTNERVDRHFSALEPRGVLRVGVSEDFAASRLSEVLRMFVARHPHVDLELTIDVSGHLYEKLDSGLLEVVFAKRRPADPRGEVALTEQLVFAGRPDFDLRASEPVPLVVFRTPSFTRALAIAALEKVGREWLVVCTSGSLSGLHAAAAAGLGVTPSAANLLPQGLADVGPPNGLPTLGLVDFVAIGPGRNNASASALISLLVENARRLDDL